MRTIALLLLAILASAPLRADDISDLKDRCGAPKRDTRSSRDVRHLYYPGVHLVYLRTSDGGWNFSHAEVNGEGTVLTSTIAAHLPCYSQAPSVAAAKVDGDAHRPNWAVPDAIGFGVIAMFICGFLLYFLPSFIAKGRDVTPYVGIVCLNLFLGWTFIGWVASLVWACTAESKTQALLREMAYRQMASMPVSQVYPTAPSNAEYAGRALGKVVGHFRGQDSDPPSIL